MALSTTDLGKEGGSGLPKTISPGNNTVKVNSVHLDEFKFIPGAYHLMLNVETKPIEGFEGFMIDKDDESKGHYAGQIGRVKAAQYAFADGKTKSGVPIQVDLVEKTDAFDVQFVNGARPQKLQFNFGPTIDEDFAIGTQGSTSVAAKSGVSFHSQDGYEAGYLKTIKIDFTFSEHFTRGANPT